jgi:hypothetical protein
MMRGDRLWHRAALFLGMVLLAMLAIGSTAQAQETGQISGTVTDPTGAAIPNATVTIKNVGTNATRTVTTGGEGGYIIRGLEPATYELSINPTGFRPFNTRVEVTVASKVTVDPKLSVTQENTTVEVTAAGGSQANTQSQELSQIVDETQVSQMPSLTRNPYDFVALGVTYRPATARTAVIRETLRMETRKTQRREGLASTSMASDPAVRRFFWMVLKTSASSRTTSGSTCPLMPPRSFVFRRATMRLNLAGHRAVSST